mmetsp:Transcript_13802/g.18016  ORF Transcript_13802/g.18016 Transcript_13802/m.18016 type:complete len:449 (+) Transcript_13802:151-1497(+)
MNDIKDTRSGVVAGENARRFARFSWRKQTFCGIIIIVVLSYASQYYLARNSVVIQPMKQEADKIKSLPLPPRTTSRKQKPPSSFTTEDLGSSSSAGDDPVWIPVSPAESKPYLKKCTHQFKHCCLGQCRQEKYENNPNSVLWKWNDKKEGAKSLANLTDVLDYIEQLNRRLESKEEEGQSTVAATTHTKASSKESSCHMYFIGDSLSSDHAMASVCQLTNVGYQLTSCNPRTIGLDLYGSDAITNCESNDLFPFPYFMLESNYTKSCRKVLITYSGGMTLPSPAMVSKVLNSNDEKGGIVVWNWGVHCNGGGTKDCMRRALEDGLLPFVKDANASKYKRWRFLFREHEPQHFESKGGTYNRGEEQKCGPIVKGKADNRRNEFAATFLSEHNLTRKVPIIPLFDALLPLWQIHHPPDCTHYCYSPWRFDVTWDGILSALSTFDLDYLRP